MGIEWEQSSPPNLFPLLNKRTETDVKIANTGSQTYNGILTMASEEPLTNIQINKPAMLMVGGEGSNVAVYKIEIGPHEKILANAATSDSVTIASGPTIRFSIPSLSVINPPQ